MAMSKSRAKSPRDGSPLVEDALCLRVRDLRGPFDWVAPDLVAADGTKVRCRVDAGEVTWLHLEHRRPNAAWADMAYPVSLISTPQHLGGERWRFLCPDGFGPCSTLFLPPGAKRFASRQAHGLVFASQRQRAPARAAARVAEIRADLGGNGTVRPKGMHAATFARRVALLKSLDGTA